ncbi:hypothetical protein SRDD_41100 [Serratia sp. DD3]|nr:hypothetical protein SRDD_41100 [Serratia sp. DD3]
MGRAAGPAAGLGVSAAEYRAPGGADRGGATSGDCHGSVAAPASRSITEPGRASIPLALTGRRV